MKIFISLNKFWTLVTLILTIILLISGLEIISAHDGDNNLVHSCIKDSNGSIRIIGANDVCDSNEHPLDWTQFASNGGGDTFGTFYTKNLNGFRTFSTNENYMYHDFNDAIFTNGILNAQFKFARFVDATFINTRFSGSADNTDFSNASFDNSRFTNFVGNFANFSNTTFVGGGFIDAEDQNNIGLSFATFEGASFTDSSFQYTDLTNVNLTNTTWVNTICPDLTNSDNNGNTCVGHIVP